MSGIETAKLGQGAGHGGMHGFRRDHGLRIIPVPRCRNVDRMWRLGGPKKLLASESSSSSGSAEGRDLSVASEFGLSDCFQHSNLQVKLELRDNRRHV
jgi:hypothetical protein